MTVFKVLPLLIVTRPHSQVNFAAERLERGRGQDAFREPRANVRGQRLIRAARGRHAAAMSPSESIAVRLPGSARDVDLLSIARPIESDNDQLTDTLLESGSSIGHSLGEIHASASKAEFRPDDASCTIGPHESFSAWQNSRDVDHPMRVASGTCAAAITEMEFGRPLAILVVPSMGSRAISKRESPSFLPSFVAEKDAEELYPDAFADDHLSANVHDRKRR